MSDSATFLDNLQKQIDNNQFDLQKSAIFSWETKKLVITSQNSENKLSQTVIVTPHAPIISYLFAQINEKLSWIFDFLDYDKFYGELGIIIRENPDSLSTKKLLSALVEKITNIFNNYPVNVFVYGTLLPGEINHYLMEGSVFLADDILENAELYDAIQYPIMIIGDGRIKGKSYQVPLKNMEGLDKLEEHPDYYCREILTLTSGEQAWVYVGKKSFVQGLARITSGDWYQRKN